MWKYILIVALVLFGFASYVFYKTHTAVVSSNGEVAALRTQLENATNKNKEVFMDEYIAEYAKMRNEWLVKRKADAEEERTRVEEETERVKQETASLEQEYETTAGLAQKQKEHLDEIIKSISSRDDLRELLEKVGADAEDMSAGDPELFEKIASNLHSLDVKKEELDQNLAQETASVEVLVARRDDLNAAIAKAEGIARDRRARISPVELESRVITADRNWDYVIIDKGVDGGVVIGSRLAVMRGDKKICELNVTLVENNRSSCDVVYSTLVVGEAVHPGDRVIAVRPNSQK